MRIEFDGNGVVFDPENNRAMTLNHSGAAIWQSIEKGMSEVEISEALMQRFEVDAETASRDTANFIEKLKERGLIESD